MSLNVNREVEDVYYRYKMPRLTVKVEGKGNGIKTVILNISEIAKAIYRKPTYPIKYFGIELGSQTILDEKAERFVVNGAHDCVKLQEMLHGFIKKFVLCVKCGNPETMLTVKRRGGFVASKCKACGHSDVLDVKHKLTQFIIKNPPETEQEGATPVREGDREAEEVVAVEDGEAWLEDLDGSKPLRGKALSLDSLSSAATQHDPLGEFFAFVTNKFQAGTLLKDKYAIKKKAKALKLDEVIMLILVEIIFKNPRTIITDVEKYKTLFQIFTRSGINTERFQNYTIGGILKLVNKFNFVSKAIFLMQAFYDNDIIEEDAILDWYDKGATKKYIPKDLCKEALLSCKPMIEWLRTAEEESVDEDEQLADDIYTVQRTQFIQPQRLIKLGEDDAIDIDNI